MHSNRRRPAVWAAVTGVAVLAIAVLAAPASARPTPAHAVAGQAASPNAGSLTVDALWQDLLAAPFTGSGTVVYKPALSQTAFVIAVNCVHVEVDGVARTANIAGVALHPKHAQPFFVRVEAPVDQPVATAAVSPVPDHSQPCGAGVGGELFAGPIRITP